MTQNCGIMKCGSNFRGKYSLLKSPLSVYFCTLSQQPGSHRQNTPLPKMQYEAKKAKRSYWYTHTHTHTHTHTFQPWPVWLNWLELHPINRTTGGFDFQSRHLPRLQVWSLVRAPYEATNRYFSPSLSPSLLFSLKSMSTSSGEEIYI